ncbi:major facilitator superfamily protein [Arthrobacter sp. Hiyo4]|nr:major facilitator superfamily protein [Arthrobacter sp. Hiyo4]
MGGPCYTPRCDNSNPLATRPASSPLYAAGFVTAFGAHSIAAGMGAQSENIGLTLLNLGILLASMTFPRSSSSRFSAP